MSPTRFLSAAEVARRLGITQRSVVYHISTGALPAQQIGGVWILREDVVTRYLARRTGARPGPKPADRDHGPEDDEQTAMRERRRRDTLLDPDAMPF